uniref:J domain-containing protein n=1 Tax=Meloidogyne javanica TaxID=6303 RepID=A0A915LTM3_MELJA
MASIYLFLLLFLINFILKIESTHYKTLMVDKNASPGEIEDAFNERKEKNRTAKQSDKAFFDNLEKLSEAHSVLSDKTKREEYDRELANKKGKSKEGESSKTAYHKDKNSQGRAQTFGGGSHHIRGGTIHNVGSTFRGNGNEEAQGRTQSFGGGSHHIREGTIHNIGSTFRGNGNGGFISGDQINMGSSFGRSPNAGSQNEEETQGRAQSFGGGSHHFRGGTIHNTGTFNGNGLVEGSDTSDSESSYDSESEFEFGKGFPFGEAGPSFRTKFTGDAKTIGFGGAARMF